MTMAAWSNGKRRKVEANAVDTNSTADANTVHPDERHRWNLLATRLDNVRAELHRTEARIEHHWREFSATLRAFRAEMLEREARRLADEQTREERWLAEIH